MIVGATGPTFPRILLIGGIGLLAAIASLVVWWSRRDPRPGPEAIPRWTPDEIVGFSAGGWSETFDRRVDRPTPLPDYDPRWQPIFGSLEVAPDRRVAAGTEGWEDGGDDYAFFREASPRGDVEITVDAWWGGEWRSLGVQGVVQPDPPHRLYEAALWEGWFSLFYFEGPLPSDYETVARVPVGELDPGFYRITFRNTHDGGRWSLDAELTALDRNEVVARVSGEDGRLPSTGYQGIGVLSGERTFVTAIGVRPLDAGARGGGAEESPARVGPG